MTRFDFDWSDFFVCLGVACLAGSVWMALGWVGALAFVGAVMLVIGLALARQEKSEGIDRGDGIKRRV
jgi:predicted phage tail protein